MLGRRLRKRSRAGERGALHDLQRWSRFVPVGALLESVRDLEDARFIERFA